MANTFTEFILKIAQDPSAAAEFQRDPDRALKATGLTTAEIAVLKSRDARMVRQVIAEEVAGLGVAGGDVSSAGITVVVLTYTRMPSSVNLDARVQPSFDTRLQKGLLGSQLRGGVR
jgi:uncharacterized protein YgbK (DUF1537 family)